MHLLIIEDDLALGEALLASLKVEGCSATWVRRLADAGPALDTGAPDAVLLDLSLPDGDGVAVLKRWRAAHHASHQHVPIYVITARATLEDRLAGLDGGADDFIVKPFATAELVSRLRAVTRRVARQSSEVWQVGDLRIEPRSHRVQLGDVPVELSPREFQLLLELAREPGQVVAKSLLARRMAPLGEPLEHGVLEVHLSNLRRKIGAQRIGTVRGIGYRLQA
jgi:two-component system response regulator QseB/two-component system response regulator BasR